MCQQVWQILQLKVELTSLQTVIHFTWTVWVNILIFPYDKYAGVNLKSLGNQTDMDVS